jgi:predicted metal-binding membrane protein
MMMWMPMPGQTWLLAAVSFIGMWVVMMVPMMLPSLVPMLWRYRRAAQTGGARIGWLTALVGGGYYFVWAAIGMIVFPVGAALMALEMQRSRLAHAVPFAVGVVVLLVGFLQLTAWKARQLACCREALGHGRATLPGDAGAAWRHGLRLGLQCSRCCGGLMLILLVVGVMDLRAMAVVTAAITAERLAPAGERVARAIGVAVVGAGLLLIVQAGITG